MGSVGNQNPWPPYNTNIDCSQGICTIYCPQFCYFFFPPPPASRSDDSTPLSPLVMALIGVIASAFLLVSYYTVVTRYCRRRSGRDAVAEHEDNEVGRAARDQWRAASGGLDESVIKTIKVRKYRRDDELIEGTDCAVCLSEFREDETLRLLPKCGHAFHVPCIDTWLRSQSNCPLCRALIAPNANPVEGQRAAIIDFVAVAVDDDDDHRQDIDVCGEQAVLRSSNHDDNGNENAEGNEDGVVKRLRRSMSLGTFTSRRHFSIPDVVGTSKGDVMKRSVSSGGLMFAVHGRGKNCSVLPN